MIYKRIKEEREALLKEYLVDVIVKWDMYYILFFFKRNIKEESGPFEAACEEGFDACCKYCKEHGISIIFEAISDATPLEQAYIDAMGDILVKYEIMVEPEAQFFYFLFRSRGKAWKAKVIYWMVHRCPDLITKRPWEYWIFGR